MVNRNWAHHLAGRQLVDPLLMWTRIWLSSQMQKLLRYKTKIVDFLQNQQWLQSASERFLLEGDCSLFTVQIFSEQCPKLFGFDSHTSHAAHFITEIIGMAPKAPPKTRLGKSFGAKFTADSFGRKQLHILQRAVTLLVPCVNVYMYMYLLSLAVLPHMSVSEFLQALSQFLPHHNTHTTESLTPGWVPGNDKRLLIHEERRLDVMSPSNMPLHLIRSSNAMGTESLSRFWGLLLILSTPGPE